MSLGSAQHRGCQRVARRVGQPLAHDRGEVRPLVSLAHFDDPPLRQGVEQRQAEGKGRRQHTARAVRAVAQTNDMSSTAVQSPERSTDDLLAFYNRLISKARALHEDENDMDQDEEDTLFEEFQHQMEDEKFGAKSL